MDQNNELEAKISKEEIKATLMVDLREIPPQLIKFLSQTELCSWEQQSE